MSPPDPNTYTVPENQSTSWEDISNATGVPVPNLLVANKIPPDTDPLPPPTPGAQLVIPFGPRNVSVAPQAQVACAAPQLVTDDFLRKVVQVAGNIQASPADLIAVMYSETNGTLRPDIWNEIIAVGLIQFTKAGLGTVSKTMTLDDVSKLSAVAQMDYVEAYFKYWAKGRPLDSAGKLYTLMYLPGLLGHDVLSRAGEPAYDQNKILDVNRDNVITTDDLTQTIALKVKSARLQNLIARMARLPPVDE